MKIKNISKFNLSIPQGTSYTSLAPGAEMELTLDDHALLNPNLKLNLQIENPGQTKVEPEAKTKA
jgi:hypothetical protein